MSHFDPKAFDAPIFAKEIIIPSDYEPLFRVRQFFSDLVQKDRDGESVKDVSFDERVLSPCFSLSDNEVVPGAMYRIEIVPVLETVTTSAVRSYLRTRHASLLGVHGLLLLLEHNISFRKAVSFAPKKKVAQAMAAPMLFHEKGLYFFDSAVACNALWTRGFEIAVFLRQ